jgi:phenylacetate-CoA ligase
MSSALLEKVYAYLPVRLQNAACSWEGWRIRRTRYSPEFYEILQEYERRAEYSVQQMAEFRDARVREIVRHCEQNVPYYQRLFAAHGFRADRCTGLKDLEQLPILTKAAIQEHCADFIPVGTDIRDCQTAHTSGTTGAGLKFLTSKRFVWETWAVWWRYRRWHQLNLGTWSGHFGGRTIVQPSTHRPPFWRVNSPGRQVMFSGYHLSAATFASYLDELNHRQLPWLHGYPSSIALLASLMLEAGRRLDYSIRWITTGAENLLPQQVSLIEQAFGVSPIQHYGMAEGVANISQYTDGNLYVDEDYAAVEFLPNDGGGYAVVGTNLTNFAFPLIRYRVGDVVELPDAAITPAGGFPGRPVTSIDGRQEDYVLLRNGARVGRMDHIFKDMTTVREAQIVQLEPGRIIVRIVRGQKYGEGDESQLRREFADRLGDQAEVRLEYVDHLQKTPRGKLRFVVSQVGKGQIDFGSS